MKTLKLGLSVGRILLSFRRLFSRSRVQCWIHKLLWWIVLSANSLTLTVGWHLNDSAKHNIETEMMTPSLSDATHTSSKLQIRLLIFKFTFKTIQFRALKFKGLWVNQTLRSMDPRSKQKSPVKARSWFIHAKNELLKHKTWTWKLLMVNIFYDKHEHGSKPRFNWCLTAVYHDDSSFLLLFITSRSTALPEIYILTAVIIVVIMLVLLVFLDGGGVTLKIRKSESGNGIF